MTNFYIEQDYLDPDLTKAEEYLAEQICIAAMHTKSVQFLSKPFRIPVPVAKQMAQ